MNPASGAQLPIHLLRGRLRGLYVITDERMGGGHLNIARAALAGGAGIIQLRDKITPLRHLLLTAHELRVLTRRAEALLIINDRIDVALASEADGVHLGPDDMPIGEARRLLGAHRLVGASCATVAEVEQATRAGADYIGAGAVFGTSTKSDAGAAIGLPRLRAIVAAANLPVAAIGGINLDNAAAVVECGVAMVCVVSAIAMAGSIEAMQAATHALAATCNVGL